MKFKMSGCTIFVFLSSLLFCSIIHAVTSFVCPSVTTTRLERMTVMMEPLAVLGGLGDSAAMMDAAIAVASGAAGAAAGAASQMPRIQKLERELTHARSALSDTEQELATKLSDLEEQLFQMDQEFESQSARMKKQFDTNLREEIEKTRNKVKQEYEFTLDIKMKKERSNMLQEKLDFLDTINGNKDAELVGLRLQQKQADSTKQKLEQALMDANNELDRINKLSKKGWWPF